jgi:hypothetical protein
MASEYPVLSKRARIGETPAAKRTDTFWYQLMVVAGPLPSGTLLRQVYIPRVRLRGALESRPNPDGQRRPPQRLQTWADSNGWNVEDEVSGRCAIATIVPPPQPLAFVQMRDER